MGFLIGAAIAETEAVRALDNFYTPPEWSAQLSRVVVAYGMGILVLSPAGEIMFRIAIPFIAAARTAHLRLRMRVWWTNFRFRRVTRDAQYWNQRATQATQRAQLRVEEGEEMALQNSVGIRAMRQFLSTAEPDDPGRAEAITYLSKAELWDRENSSWLNRGREIIASAPPVRGEHVARELESEGAALKQELTLISKEQRQALAVLLEQSVIGLNPLIPPPPVAPIAVKQGNTGRRRRVIGARQYLGPRRRRR